MFTRRGVFLVGMLALAGGAAAGPASEEAPVKVSVKVAPAPIAAGGDAAVTLELVPKPGIKLNKYPKIKLVVPALPGVAGAAEASIGNASAPSADQLESNYYKGAVDPLSLSLHVDEAATPGPHEIAAKLSYFYCVAASGYCAPAKVPVSIPITVR
ncbi:MAG TPA: hypothetical protein VFB67_07235 [Candidatus Polarisedimenticolaceae bacterium]|nr:hypothetical protein [Candidatus Polarisedimenticolaceae bacterium]